MNIFKNEKIYSSFSPWPRNVLLGVGGLNSLSKADILLQVSKNSSEAGRGMEKKSGAGLNEPDAWVYSGQKGFSSNFCRTPPWAERGGISRMQTCD
jgi:hypothetical protein